jgi:hypothetical protein
MLTDFENMRLLRTKAGNSKIIRKALADGCKYITPRGKSAEKGPLANGVTSWALLRYTVLVGIIDHASMTAVLWPNSSMPARRQKSSPQNSNSIIREIHREILARKPPDAAISNRAIDRAIARALAARMHGSWTPAQVAALLDRRPPS